MQKIKQTVISDFLLQFLHLVYFYLVDSLGQKRDRKAARGVWMPESIMYAHSRTQSHVHPHISNIVLTWLFEDVNGSQAEVDGWTPQLLNGRVLSTTVIYQQGAAFILYSQLIAAQLLCQAQLP